MAADIKPVSVTAETPTVKPPEELASKGEGWKAEYEAQGQTGRAQWEEISASQLNDPQQQQQQDVGYKTVTNAGESPAQVCTMP